jgi:hypothetical protein
MKAKLLAVALLAVALAACGGKASFVIAGTIAGLTNSGLKLQNNGGDTIEVAAGATSFSFPNSISYGTEYRVSIAQQPQHMTCDFLGATNVGSAGHTTSINIQMACALNRYTVSGNVTGLTTGDLVLVNGSDSGTFTVSKGAENFSLPGTLAVGTAYGISIFTQPPGATCTIENGSGVMGDAPRNDVKISCKANP